MNIPLYQVDAFTSRPFSGNPAGVCLLNAERSDTWMLAVAAEMNLSETAFLLAESDGYRLRWFTPKVEMGMCGHATLASAHILWETGIVPVDCAIRFYTRSGLLTAVRRDDWIELNFPVRSYPDSETDSGLEEALGVHFVSLFKKQNSYFAVIDSEQAVRHMRPDFTRLNQLGVRSVVVTARSTVPEYDCISRFFAPGVGINEDPVTGSAHCAIGPYWSARLGKTDLVAYQASERGGILKVGVRGDRVLLTGQAVTVFRAELGVD